MDIEIISRENIKPSSPTPSHLRNYKLSLLDQFIPSVYVPMVLFYPLNTTDDQNLTSHKKVLLLKESLSTTLSHFYPFAGKIKDKLTIDCNDEGAYFAEAQVKTRMKDFLKHPNHGLLQQFLPREAKWNQADSGCHLSMFQVNVFDCGGIAIGVFVSHMIADGTAISSFLKSWAAIASGSQTESTFPSFISSSLFPQNDTILEETMMGVLSPFFKQGKCVMRRFVFDSESLSVLKAKATNSCNGHIPTRVQSVTALIWKSFIATHTALSKIQRPSLVTHAVDLRRRASPPFSELCMGNFLWSALAQCKDECGTELHQLVGEIKEAIDKVDAKFVKELEGEMGVIKYREARKDMSQEMDKEANHLSFTSWLNFGLYTVDFGWGKPAWATSVGSVLDSHSIFLNIVILLETKEGDGMEAWVYLGEQDMAIFECNSELLSFASVHHGGDKLD